MAFTVTEIGDRDCDVANSGERTYSRTFRVVSTDMLVGQRAAVTAFGVPELFAAYVTDTESDLECRVVRKSARPESDDWLRWLVRVEYSSEWIPVLRDQSGIDPATAMDAGSIGADWTPPNAPTLTPAEAAKLNPLFRPAEVAISSQRTTKPFEFDLDGFPVLNAAGETFDPPPTIEDGTTVITITRNVALFDVTTADRYRFSVNSEPFFSFLPGEAMAANYSATRVYENGIYFDRVTWTFECRDGGMEFVSILNQGFMETDEDASVLAGEQVTREILVGPNPPTRPRLLDEDGFQLDVVTRPPVPAVFLRFRARRRRNFADLGVPTSAR